MILITIHSQPPLYLSVGDHAGPHHDTVHQPGVRLTVPGLVLGEVVSEVAADVGCDISELFSLHSELTGALAVCSPEFITEEILLKGLSEVPLLGGVVDVPLRRGVRGGGRGGLLTDLTDD